MTTQAAKYSACEYKYQWLYLEIHKGTNPEEISDWKFPLIEQRCAHGFFLFRQNVCFWKRANPVCSILYACNIRPRRTVETERRRTHVPGVQSHMGKGGKGRGCTPPEGKKQVPSPAPEKWVPITKNPWSLLLYIPFFGLFYCICLFFHQTEKLQQLANDWKKHFLFSNKQLFSFMCKIFSPPLHPLFTQARTAKNITSHIAIFDPCTHQKKFFPPSTKKAVPMCVYNIQYISPRLVYTSIRIHPWN